MKKVFFVSTLFLISFLFSTAFCAPYVGIFGGAAADYDLKHSSIKANCGYYIGGKIGFTSCSFLRFEEEFSYQSSQVHSVAVHGIHLNHSHGEVEFWSLMSNALIDPKIPFIITPYFGGGIGYSRGSGKAKGSASGTSSHFTEKVHSNAFAWQGIVGLKYLVCLGFEASLEYRYFKISDVDANHKLGVALTKVF